MYDGYLAIVLQETDATLPCRRSMVAVRNVVKVNDLLVSVGLKEVVEQGERQSQKGKDR